MPQPVCPDCGVSTPTPPHSLSDCLQALTSRIENLEAQLVTQGILQDEVQPEALAAAKAKAARKA